MKYLGGKVRIAKGISSAILETVPDRERYLEPFCGGCAVLEKMAPHFHRCLASDIHPDLILMWQALMNGWVPPGELSEAEWRELKNSEPSALRGFAGFACSYGGKWFDSYARNGRGHHPGHRRGSSGATEGKNTTTRARDSLRRAIVEFRQLSYDQVRPSQGTVVYCDPPYSQGAGYSNGRFDSITFWMTVRQWAENGAHVFVSEYESPLPEAETEIIWEKERNLELSGGINGKCSKRLERLFYVRSAEK
jgi:DNA adenine methylase